MLLCYMKILFYHFERRLSCNLDFEFLYWNALLSYKDIKMEIIKHPIANNNFMD